MTALTPHDLADLHAAIRADRNAEVTGQATPTERVEAVVERIKAEAARDARAAIVARLDAIVREESC